MSVLSWSHVRSCKLIRWRCILQCFFAWSVAVLLVLSREWMGLGVAGMIITSDYGSFPHSLLSTSKLQCICVFVAVQVWRYDTILPGITSQRMLHGSMERHWRLGWYHVLSRCLDHVFSVCILQWLTCKIIMNCFVGYHEVSSPWFPKPSWLCYHRHIRLSDGLPHDPKVTIGPWSLESFAPGTRDTRGGGRASPKIRQDRFAAPAKSLDPFRRWVRIAESYERETARIWREITDFDDFDFCIFLPFWLHIY